MGQLLQWEHKPNNLRAPAVVVALRGWSDAAEGSSTAIRYINRMMGGKEFASFDSEKLFDYQANRPVIDITDGRVGDLKWPTITANYVRIPRAPRDLILIYGREPSFHWQGFCESILELSETLGAQLIVTLGSLLADVPHTKPSPVTGVASDDFLLERLSIEPPNYYGPTGIVGSLHAITAQAGIPSVSLWSAVPHYVAGTVNPKAALALIRKLESLVGIAIDASELERQSIAFEQHVDKAVSLDPEIKKFVERLEQTANENADGNFDPSNLPSGDALAQDFQRFLRQRGSED